jgi:hypothetical protein
MSLYREDFYFVARRVRTFLTDDNVPNEVVKIHRSRKALKILALYTLIFFVKNTGTTVLIAFTEQDTAASTGRSGTSWIRCGSVNSSCDYFAYLCISAS